MQEKEKNIVGDEQNSPMEASVVTVKILTSKSHEFLFHTESGSIVFKSVIMSVTEAREGFVVESLLCVEFLKMISFISIKNCETISSSLISPFLWSCNKLENKSRYTVWNLSRRIVVYSFDNTFNAIK